MDTGWTIDHVLKMPAIRFFSFKKACNKVRDERLSYYFYEMCDVTGLSGKDNETHQQLKTYYRKQFADESTVSRINNPRVFDLAKKEDQAQVVNFFQSVVKYMR